MNKFLIILLTLLSFRVFGQKTLTEKAQPIVAEGKMLYRSEMASWYGTDVFVENYKDKANIGGYFSYTDRDISTCVFFSTADNPVVIGTISFDSSYNVKTAKLDLSERAFTAYEKDLYQIRESAIAETRADTLFKTYKNTNLNFIPILNGKEKKVYVLTGPQKEGVVIFGNDYLLTFDKNNKLLLKKQLHVNIIPNYFGEKQDDVVGAIHNHLPETGDFITATDICTLMLYEKLAKWKTYNVVSEKYLNTWNCETDQLTVMTKKAVRKIIKDQEKRNKKKNKDE
jgi:hypothetical protein